MCTWRNRLGEWRGVVLLVDPRQHQHQQQQTRGSAITPCPLLLRYRGPTYGVVGSEGLAVVKGGTDGTDGTDGPFFELPLNAVRRGV